MVSQKDMQLSVTTTGVSVLTLVANMYEVLDRTAVAGYQHSNSIFDGKASVSAHRR